MAVAARGAKQADPSLFDSRAELGIRVCMRSYRLFFVPGTEDCLARRPAPPVATSSLRDDEPAVADAAPLSARSEAAASEVRSRRKARWDSILEKLAEKAELGSRQKPVEVVASPTPAPPPAAEVPPEPVAATTTEASVSIPSAAPDVSKPSVEPAPTALAAPVGEPVAATGTDATV